MNRTHLRGVYGRPLAKASGQKITLTYDQISRAAEIILDSIKKEINRDVALVSGIRPKGEPVPLPRTVKFAESFKVTIQGSIINISSDWPTAVAHTTDATKVDLINNVQAQPSAPIPMVWLTQPSVPYARIVRSNGEVVVRTTPNPSQGEKVWIHPGFKKYTFLERGIRKGRLLVVETLAEELVASLLSQHDLF